MESQLQHLKTDETHSDAQGTGDFCTASVCSMCSVVLYNMHGFNQGCHTVRDLILFSKSTAPDVFLLIS